MLKRFRQKLGKTNFVRKLIEEPADLDTFRQKPTTRFSVGIAVIIFSYLVAWPFISVLGIFSLLIGNTMILAVGGPLAYGISYLVLFLGVWLAGKDGLVYIKVLTRWFMAGVCRKLLILEETEKSAEEV